MRLFYLPWRGVCYGWSRSKNCVTGSGTIHENRKRQSDMQEDLKRSLLYLKW